MTISRRAALTRMTSLLVAIGLSGRAGAEVRQSGPDAGARAQPRRLRKIATEEAWATHEVAAALRGVVRRGGRNLELALLRGMYDAPAGTPPRFLPQLLDAEGPRLAEMDAHGVDMHLLSLTAPGVQMFTPDVANTRARLTNDRLAELVRRHPKRFAALASFAPQDPRAAVKEMGRAVNTLKLNGFIVNSHTDNAYLDQLRFWPILARRRRSTPRSTFTRGPPPTGWRSLSATTAWRAPSGATGSRRARTHAVRLMLSGVLDRFPRLRVVLGQMGEALPFWMWRLDFMGAPGARAAGRPNQLKPSEYFRRNFAITTGGVEDPLALRFCIDKLGVDGVMWAIDYPYQPTAPAVKFLESAPLSDRERSLIAHGKAERIFRIRA